MVYTTYKNGDLGDGLSLFYPTYCNYSYTSIFFRGESEDEWIHHRKSHHWIGLRQPRKNAGFICKKRGPPNPMVDHIFPTEMAFSDTH